MSSTSSIPAPTDAELLVHLKAIYEKDSSLGAEKVLKQILAENPQWVGKVGLKRVKQIRSDNGLICTAPGAPGSSTYVPPPTYEYETVQDTLLTDLLAFRRSVASGQPLSNSQLRRAQELLERANAVEEIDASVVDGHGSKTSGPSSHVKRQLDSRASAAPEAFQEQNRLHVEAQKKGKPHGAGIYAVLQDGEEEYVEERVVWVDTVAAAVTDEQGQVTEEAKQAAVVMLERGKAEALLGNPAGVYLIYKSLWSALQELDVVKKGQVRVSERSLAKQLKNEYGIDVLPFKTEAEKDPMGPAGQRLIALLTSMTY